jgi:hypothetical protein
MGPAAKPAVVSHPSGTMPRGEPLHGALRGSVSQRCSSRPSCLMPRPLDLSRTLVCSVVRPWPHDNAKSAALGIKNDGRVENSKNTTKPVLASQNRSQSSGATTTFGYKMGAEITSPPIIVVQKLRNKAAPARRSLSPSIVTPCTLLLSGTKIGIN